MWRNFGEYVMYLKLESEGKDKGERRWSEGVFLGVKEESGEIIVGIEKGVVQARTFKRFGSEEERWEKGKGVEFKGSAMGIDTRGREGRAQYWD